MDQPDQHPTEITPAAGDEWLFGWDPTPGIVGVWADRRGAALVWQRLEGRLRCRRERFRPWLVASSLADLDQPGGELVRVADAWDTGAALAYQELDGPAGAYRYLLSARDGRALEQAILAGAGRRLGRPVRRLGELGDSYYAVGPVEQYLMQTGRVCFRGLAYADVHRLQFDLETTALDPAEGRIFMVAVRDSQGLATVLEAPAPEDEGRLIADLCALIRRRDPDIIENHNLFGFDLPFLWERARRCAVPLRLGRAGAPALLTRYDEPGSQRRRRTRFSAAGRDLVDTLEAVWRHDFVTRTLPGYGLKAVARAFGVAAPDRVYLPGHAVYATYQADPERVRRYALDDVDEVDGLSSRLLGAAFALAGMTPRPYERVAAAGPAMGILEPMLVRAYLRSRAALPRQTGHSGQSGAHSGGATHLFAAGVARQVVKADIASMYPSIMRVYQIGPACDPLRVLLTLVDRLTALRLEHKAALRAAEPGSAPAHRHDALQAAMKLVINSAYGYMGAGSMALFADRDAADAVTSQGRAILDQVVEGLRSRGMALLEADTDGVYFAAPLGWGEEQERAVVAAVAATLPAGIQLEYEGRYRAMLSHEVKNYALLTYGGELIVRGGALRSSRSEPFGNRFLHAALACLLRDDVAGMQRVYQETVAALRERRLPVEDVASSARLTKTPEEYAASRSRMREGPYEALLAAGRSWAAGTRVRFYRSSQSGFVALPADDEDDPAPAEALPPYDSEHYVQVLDTSYASRLRKAFAPEGWSQLLRADGQRSLFDQPVAGISPLWIEAD
ncbi:MAG TPA: DNA polymerase domain-containing protein [Herpetosiphonaceae bacterium]|nr:DNA polymerase domain-containing protein [Herpetosiphonaceae bacterium]